MSKIQKKEYENRKRELLTALQKLHDPLSAQEIQFLADTDDQADFKFELTDAPSKKTCSNPLFTTK